jgi:serine protease AprX
MTKENNPILVVRTSSEDFLKKNYNFGPKEPLRHVTRELIERLAEEASQVENHFKESFQRWPDVPGVAKVTLHDKALAKSHRPKNLLADSTCPIIGSCGLGELLVSVTPDGIENLKIKIGNSAKTKSGSVNLAAIEKIEPYVCQDDGVDEGDFKSYMLRTFDHYDRKLNRSIETSLFQIMEEFGLQAVHHKIGGQLNFYEVVGNNHLDELMMFTGLRTLLPMPQYSTCDFGLQFNPVCPLDEDLMPPPEKDKHYPLVGVIDSGVDPENSLLAPWVWDRMDCLAGKAADYSHGSMVAGLIINGQGLNNGNPLFPITKAEIVDVVAFPAEGTLSLVELMGIIQNAVTSYPEVRVWNLSLGAEGPCAEDSFSELGHLLNYLHDENGCLFVVASGNYVSKPQRTWPPQDLNGIDRISAPGDSVRSLTVGSVAHQDHATTVVRAFEPSSFSRRGPGPAFTPKPDVSHFGGNCDANLRFNQVGILSTGADGMLVENIGTSFATPIVSSITASVWHELQISGNINPIPERVKALLVHAAMLNAGQLSSDDVHYHGFGKPTEVIDVLTCNDHEVTFMFEVDTKEGEEFGRTPFIIPDSLRNNEGKFRGEVVMTLAYSPPLNFDYPSEYCRSNVDVSFGTYDLNSDNVRSHSGKIPQIKDKSELYEKALVENGFKWSPVKVYKKRFPKGIKGVDWRLKMDVMRRAEESVLEHPQRAVLIITMRSFDEGDNVYREAVRQMKSENWEAQTIISKIKPMIKVR